jgi:hypothetical protein
MSSQKKPKSAGILFFAYDEIEKIPLAEVARQVGVSMSVISNATTIRTKE